MTKNIQQLIDIKKVDSLLDKFFRETGFVTAILDLEGNVLSKSGWRQICTQFHRKCPETAANCVISDTLLANAISEGSNYHHYKCLNGLIDVAVPIKIDGEHVANLFSGQFFFEQPDVDFFRQQAQKFGFEEDEYLKAVSDVPVVSEEKVKLTMDFLLDMTLLISELGFQKVKQEELNQHVRKNEERFRQVAETAQECIWEVDVNGMYTYVSPIIQSIIGHTPEELIGKKCFYDLFAPEKGEKYKESAAKIFSQRKNFRNYENALVHKNGHLVITSTSGSPVFDEEGNFTGYRGVNEDISERKKAEESLLVKMHELERFHSLMVGREMAMIKLKKEVNSLLQKMGGEAKYKIVE